ncbi:MAG: Lrp/AsnC ligand binding domain-containing protein [Nitrososphaeria archaeon]
MMKACLLVKTVPVKGVAIEEEVSKIREVKKAFQTYGRADMVVLVEARSFDDILDIIAKVHLIDGVRSTETLVEAW